MSSNPGAPAPAAVEFDRLPPSWAGPTTRPKLPVGIAILAVLIALFAVVMVLGGLLFLLTQIAGNLVPPALDPFPTLDLFGAAILLVVGIALLAIATSLWRQETWALWTTIVLVFLTIAYLFFTGAITVLFLVLIALFVYLLAVRRYFY